MNNIESVIRKSLDVRKDVYHLRQPSTEVVEIKDDDNSDDEPDNIPSVTVTQGGLHALIEEEEDKDEEAHKEEMDEDTISIVAEVIASLPHTPPDTITSMESTSTSKNISLTVTSFTQSSPSTS